MWTSFENLVILWPTANNETAGWLFGIYFLKSFIQFNLDGVRSVRACEREQYAAMYNNSSVHMLAAFIAVSFNYAIKWRVQKWRYNNSFCNRCIIVLCTDIQRNTQWIQFSIRIYQHNKESFISYGTRRNIEILFIWFCLELYLAAQRDCMLSKRVKRHTQSLHCVMRSLNNSELFPLYKINRLKRNIGYRKWDISQFVSILIVVGDIFAR